MKSSILPPWVLCYRGMLVPGILVASLCGCGYTTNFSSANSQSRAVETPVMSPGQGTSFTSSLAVSISDATPGAIIYYTTNGSTPSAASATYPGPITLTASTTINAIAIASGFNPSQVSSASYTLSSSETVAAAPVFSPAAGTSFDSTLTISLADSTSDAAIYYTTDGSTPTTSSISYSGPITISASTTLKAIAISSGYSQSAVSSANYSFVTPQTAVVTPSISPASGTSFASSLSVSISDSTPGATIYYTTNGSAPTTSSQIYSGPITLNASTTINAIATANGYIQSSISSASYTLQSPTATPTINPASGASFPSWLSVSISDGTPGATIYYTINGSAPTTSSQLYSGPITLNATTTINAIATANGYTQSSISSASYTLQSPTAAPTINPVSGTSFPSSLSVSIMDSTPGATIYYTTNGSAPTTSSQLYSGPITLNASTTINAIAIANGYTQSTVSSASYTLQSPTAAPTISPASGTSFPSSLSVSISDGTPGATIYYTTNGSAPTTSSQIYSGPITLNATTTINAIATANGYTQSSISSASYTLQSPTATPTISPASGASFPSSLSVSISDGTPGATIYYTTNGSAPTTSSQIYSGPFTLNATTAVNAIATANGYTQSTVSSASYTLRSPAAAPTISPASGTSFASSLSVSISDSTPGATIYYTTNGSAPTTSSQIYSGPITLNASTTINAIAIANGYTQSSISSASYTLQSPTAAPTISPASGASFASSLSISISDGTPGATIYYTTNGSAPTTSSQIYSGPITLNATTAINAIATANGYTQSTVSSASYTLQSPTAAPTISPASGASFASSLSISISDGTPGATIYYTTNGSAPTTSSQVYSGPFTLNTTTTINAIATANGYTQSTVSSASYTLQSPAAAPTISPASGTSFSFSLSVSISDSTPGATIYYTTDGSAPTTSSQIYSGPITLNATTTINAIATANGDNESAIGTATYTYNPLNNGPSFNLSVQPASITLAPGLSQTIVVATNALNGFSEAVDVTLSNLPPGITASPQSSSVPPGSSQQITFSASSNFTSGGTATLNANSGKVAQSQLIVFSALPPAPPSLVTDGLLAYFPMDEGFGSSIQDVTSNGYVGTFGGLGTDWLPGGISFNGQGWIDLPEELNSAQTIQMWLSIPAGSPTTPQSLLGGSGPCCSGNTDWQILPMQSGEPMQEISGFAYGAFRALSVSPFLGSATLTFAMGSTSKETTDQYWVNQNQVFYQQGPQNAIGPTVGASAGSQTDGHYQIGAAASGYNLNATVGPVAFYNRQLAPAEIAANAAYFNQLEQSRGLETQLGNTIHGNQFVGMGDSITFGYPRPGGPYCQFLAFSASYNSYCQGMIGQTSSYGLSEAPQFAQYYAEGAAKNVMLVWFGTNDVTSGTPVTQIFANLLSTCQTIKQIYPGWKVLLATMLSRYYNGLDYDPYKNSLNTLIRENATQQCDGFIDTASDPNLGADGAYGNSYFYDETHPTEQGYEQIGAMVSSYINSLDGYTVENPNNQSAAQYQMSSADNFINANINGNGSWTLPECQGLTGKIYQINNEGPGSLIVSGTNAEIISGSNEIEPGATASFRVNLVSPSAAGCDWIRT